MPAPTRADLLAATHKTVADVIAPNLQILFCGINPGLYSAYSGHHFARPGNRFWPALHLGGFTPRLFSPAEEQELLPLGYGITNLVQRASATADELTKEELAAGASGWPPRSNNIRRACWPCWVSAPTAAPLAGRAPPWGCSPNESARHTSGSCRIRAD